MVSILALALGFGLDLLFGDPHGFPHPVRAIGWMIEKGESLCREKFSSPRLAGGVLVAAVCAVCYVVPLILLFIASLMHPMVQLVVESVMIYQLLAARSLWQESMAVFHCLARGDLPAARNALSMIVGRDTQHLQEDGIARAAVETVAENTSDGVVAPLFFIALGGAPLGFLYKGVNTLDSMIGYKNEKYIEFGKVAARLDDVLNWVPARVGARLMLLGAFLLELDGRNAIRIYLRDRRNHTSPNSAHTEAACAGALHIQLGGPSYYFGKLVEKPTIGDDDRPVEKEDIQRANQLMMATSCLALFCALAVRLLIVMI